MKEYHNVITAGPSAGKSSTIRELSRRGYYTAPEAARIRFDEAISNGVDPETVRAADDFHEQIESIDRDIENNVPDDRVVFYDRSLADNIAYRRAYGNDGDIDQLINEVSDKYDTIFVLERIDFVDDVVRSEDEQEAQQMHETIISTYEDLGYDPIVVPVMPVSERANMIEEQITHPQPIH